MPWRCFQKFTVITNSYFILHVTAGGTGGAASRSFNSKKSTFTIFRLYLEFINLISFLM